MSKTPLFTVLVANYSHAESLTAALDSLLAQTDPDWEAIVVNDGSSDATAQVLEGYCRKDGRFRTVQLKNARVSSFLNEGLRQAKGRWTCRLTSGDLFDSRKLNTHREWIRKHPQCRFFFTDFRYLEEKTGQISDPPLRPVISDQEWQVLEMLRCTYIHANSICVEHDAWQRVGIFDEDLEDGQDYDMWLRLMAVWPAVFIPEQTCITRHHALQEPKAFPKAGFFDCANAGINFLNQHRFPELVPLFDLSDPKMAQKAISKALDVAVNPHGYLYRLGTHPALLLRIMEWAWELDNHETASLLKKTIRSRLTSAARLHSGTTFGFLLRAASVATHRRGGKFIYQPIPQAEVAERNYWLLKHAGNREAEEVRRYLRRSGNHALKEATSESIGQSREIVIPCEMGTSPSDSVSGALRATFEAAKYLMRSGHSVLLVGVSDQGLGFSEGVMFIGREDDQSSARAVASVCQDTLMMISRGDCLRTTRAKRCLIYHHGPYPPFSVPISVLNKAAIPVVCVSNYSKLAQMKFGVHAGLLHVAPNGCDHQIFYPTSGQERHPHSLIYAAHVVDYKGPDIALRAFSIIRDRFPDAVFHIYGKTCSWRTFKAHLFADGWLDSGGFPVWSSIERDLPGFKYCGEVSQAELADALRQHSLLIMSSRIAEALPLVSLEAQACGCIPVLPRQGGFPETMVEGKTGYLYDEITPEGLAAKIRQLWEHDLPTELQRVEAQQWLQDTFSWDRSGHALLGILESSPPIPPRTSAMQIALWQLWRLERCKGLLFRLLSRLKRVLLRLLRIGAGVIGQGKRDI